MKHKHTLLLSALMLTALTSVFVGTGATAYAAEVCTHEYDEHIIEATCTEMGYTEYVCSLCGESYKDNYTEAKVSYCAFSFRCSRSKISSEQPST